MTVSTGWCPCRDDGLGQPVLLAADLQTWPGVWSIMAAALMSDFRVIQCDVRGDRSSGQGTSPADGLNEVMESLGLGSAHLVGFGDRCSALTQAACEMPDRVLSLTVIDPVRAELAVPKAPDQEIHLDVLIRWLEAGCGPQCRQGEHMNRLRDLVAEQTLSRFGDPDAPCEAPERLDLARLNCPVLVLVGSEEGPERRRLIATTFGEAPHCQFSLVPGARRHSPVEAPAVVTLLLERFLSCLFVSP